MKRALILCSLLAGCASQPVTLRSTLPATKPIPPANHLVVIGKPALGWDILAYPKISYGPAGSAFVIGIENSPKLTVCGQEFRYEFVVPGNSLRVHIPDEDHLVGGEVYVRHISAQHGCEHALITNEAVIKVLPWIGER